MIFLESPWPVLLIGIAVEAVLAVLLLRTGQGRFLWAMLGVAALTLAGLLVERLVVTEREEVTDTLDACVAAVEANDLNRLLNYVSPTATQTRADARFVLGRALFETVWISNLEITINRLTSPPTAKAKFKAWVTGRDRLGEIPYRSEPIAVTVTLRKEKGHWLVADYDRSAAGRP